LKLLIGIVITIFEFSIMATASYVYAIVTFRMFLILDESRFISGSHVLAPHRNSSRAELDNILSFPSAALALTS